MTEETLKHRTMEGLVDLMLLTTNEFLEAVERRDEIEMRAKKNQVDLLHQIIIAKRAEPFAES
jgi:hypothetical protein